MRKLISLFTLLFICFILFSCASGTAFVTGKKRPYVNPDRISIYTAPPEDYEVIGIVSASSDSGFTDQGSLNYAIAELKKQAGKIQQTLVVIVLVKDWLKYINTQMIHIKQEFQLT